MTPKYMTKHPLRNRLTKSDWKRIQDVIDDKIPNHNASLEEIDAASDVFHDAVVEQKQTHATKTRLQ